MAIEIIIFFVLVAASAFFSLTETAFVSLPTVKFMQFVEKKRPAARLAQRLKNELSKLISIALVGNNIVNTGASVLGAAIIFQLFRASGLTNEGAAIGAATGILTLILLMFCDIVPKTVAIKRAERFVLVLAWPIYLIMVILTPFEIVLRWLSYPFVKLLGGKMPEHGPFISEEDLRFYIEASEKEGAIERDEKELLSSVFRFGDLKARQVMTERDKMACVSVEASVGETVAVIRKSGHSRLPVYDQNLNNIVGVVYAKDLLEARSNEKIGPYLRQALFIPAEKMINDLLDQMQAEYKHLAIVVDEFGHTLGLVTLEDLVEEIVGEIHDEYERRK
ncbi:MAG: hemolysin family protein [Candidatus Margulisbacteria bacterium]|jgi:CBS domain containing-hemolysin-like protein|nr:hemolysin family protein [Candidatus Margulisiibacteriota bacterium]